MKTPWQFLALRICSGVLCVSGVVFLVLGGNILLGWVRGSTQLRPEQTEGLLGAMVQTFTLVVAAVLILIPEVIWKRLVSIEQKLDRAYRQETLSKRDQSEIRIPNSEMENH